MRGSRTRLRAYASRSPLRTCLASSRLHLAEQLLEPRTARPPHSLNPVDRAGSSQLSLLTHTLQPCPPKPLTADESTDPRSHFRPSSTMSPPSPPLLLRRPPSSTTFKKQPNPTRGNAGTRMLSGLSVSGALSHLQTMRSNAPGVVAPQI